MNAPTSTLEVLLLLQQHQLMLLLLQQIIPRLFSFGLVSEM